MRAISFSRGKGKIRHNNRDFLSSNVDPNRVADNIILKQQPLSEAYHVLFDEAVNAYNEKQKRAERRIDDYFVKLFGKHNDDKILTNDNKQQSFYEYVVGVGSMFDTGLVDSVLEDGTEIKANPEAAKIAAECLKEYILGNPEIGVESFEKRNPNFYIFNAVIHLDEKSPHLHYDLISYSDGYKKGMTRQQGMAKALEAMGYGKGEMAIYNFTQTERLVFQKICEAHGFEIKPQEKGRGFTIPTRMMSTYYPILQSNEKKIMEQEEQIKTNFETIENQKTQEQQLEKDIAEQTELLISEHSGRKKLIPKMTAPEPDIDDFDMRKNSDVRKYNRQIDKYNKSIRNNNSKNDDILEYNAKIAKKNGELSDQERISRSQKVVAEKQAKRDKELAEKQKQLEEQERYIQAQVAILVKQELERSERYAELQSISREWDDRYSDIYSRTVPQVQQLTRQALAEQKAKNERQVMKNDDQIYKKEQNVNGGTAKNKIPRER